MTVRDKDEVLTASASQGKIPADLVHDDDKVYQEEELDKIDLDNIVNQED